jgi:hypothetical protein
MNHEASIRARRLDDMADAYRTLATAARAPRLVPPDVLDQTRERIKNLSILLAMADGLPAAEAVKVGP